MSYNNTTWIFEHTCVWRLFGIGQLVAFQKNPWAIVQWPCPWLRHCTDPLALDLISRSSGYGSSRLDGSFNPNITHFNHGVYTDHNRPVNPNLACFNRSYRPGINNIGFLKTCEECGYTNHKNFNTCQGKGCSRNRKINWKMTKRLFFVVSWEKFD